MTLKLNTASGGSVSLVPTNTASTLTLSVPALTGSLVAADASGHVGIGITTSAWDSTTIRALQIGYSGFWGGITEGVSHVTTNTYFDGTNYKALLVGSASDYYQLAGNHVWRYANGLTSGANIAWSEAMRIDSNGNLLVGMTSGVGGVPPKSGFVFETVGNVKIREAAGAFAQFYSATGAYVGNISTNGSSTSYNTTSDYRLKENVAPMTGALATVAALKPCTYTWKADGSAGQGFIAHELQAVVPDCVTGEKDAVRIVDELDEEGNKIGTKEEPQYQGVDTSFLVATLVAAIQEQQTIINQLKSRIEALEQA